MAEARVAFVTARDWAELTADDRLLVDALAARGVATAPALWDDASVDWTAYDLVVIRSCWDYYRRAAEFRAWIDRLDAAGVALWNPPAVARWNMDKRYLRDLEARGVDIVPTAWVTVDDVERGATLGALLAERGWQRAVVKPVVSAAAHATWQTSDDGRVGEADEARFREAAARGPLMVQPFLDVVRAEGEWSLLFFDGEFNHAVVKRPAEGDFRVQFEHGGSAERAAAPPALVEAGSAALAAAPDATLYARVDGCVVDGRFLLMELEVLEPSLFLAQAPGAADRLARAIARRLD